MPDGAGEPGARIVGREPELALLHEFLGAGGSLGALVLSGGPGIGKTTLWEAAVDVARERGLRVLSARPSDAEARLAFAALTDLLDDVDTKTLEGLPTPQRRALDVALLRAEPTGIPPEQRAIALGFTNVLRALAGQAPLLIAIDDVQWLDAPSADVLAFAARRVEGDAVGFVIATRSGDSSALERVLEPTVRHRLEVGPLSLGATQRILSTRLGLSLPRRVLRQVYEAAQGNPLLALELGRALAEHGPLAVGEEIPVSDAVEDLLGTRVERLAHPVRRLLLAVALSADLQVSQLAEIADPAALDDAREAGLLVVDDGKIRPSHPLLATAVRTHASSRERRELHAELARAVAEDALRARHLALATELPDADLAATVAAAAAGASARGAAEDAVELAEHALRLTPAETDERSERLLALAEYLVITGDEQRLYDLVAPDLEALPSGQARGRAHLLLADGGGISNVDDVLDHLESALIEGELEPELRVTALARKAEYTAVARVAQISDAERWATDALSAGRSASPAAERLALNTLGWVRILRGLPVEDLRERYRAAGDDVYHIADSVDRAAGVRLLFRGEVHDARAMFAELLRLSDDRGEAWSYVAVCLHQCELELRAGGWSAASLVLDEWEPADGMLLPPVYDRCRALLSVGRGVSDEAETWATTAISGAETIGLRWDVLEAQRARGIAALLAHEPERAATSLRAVWEHTEREGVEDPGVFPVAPDLVEALVEVGEPDEAQVVNDRLRALAEQQRHPWGLATAKRCDGLIRLASTSYDEQGAAALGRAAVAYERLGLCFDSARSLLGLGRAQRRQRKWAAARGSLEQAAAAFDELDSTGWADEARSELARVGARRPRAAGELTPAERRVAELAAEGLTNKEIAQTLFVSVHTVEVHLSHAYAKLGIRSRTQVARRLSQV